MATESNSSSAEGTVDQSTDAIVQAGGSESRQFLVSFSILPPRLTLAEFERLRPIVRAESPFSDDEDDDEQLSWEQVCLDRYYEISTVQMWRLEKALASAPPHTLLSVGQLRDFFLTEAEKIAIAEGREITDAYRGSTRWLKEE